MTRSLLHERSLSFERMQEALLACIPAVISISCACPPATRATRKKELTLLPLNSLLRSDSPGGSSRHAEAVVNTIATRLGALQKSATCKALARASLASSRKETNTLSEKLGATPKERVARIKLISLVGSYADLQRAASSAANAITSRIADRPQTPPGNGAKRHESAAPADDGSASKQP